MLQYAYRCPHKPDWCHTKQIGTINSLCGVGKGQNYIKLLSTSHKPQSAPVTKADPGLMIQTTLGRFALYHLQSDTVLATQHSQSCMSCILKDLLSLLSHCSAPHLFIYSLIQSESLSLRLTTCTNTLINVVTQLRDTSTKINSVCLVAITHST